MPLDFILKQYYFKDNVKDDREGNMDKSKIKVGILNHWEVNNYGALFLAYALEKTINKLDYNVETINYLPDEIKRPWDISMIRKIGFATYFLRLCYFLTFILPRKNSFSGMRASMNISNDKYNNKTIKNIKNKYDKIVIGGDQLWNTKINYYNQNYFLPFIEEEKKKVVYAASISQPDIRKDLLPTFKELAGHFYYITAREKQTAQILNKHLSLKVPQVIDPAFLLTAREWGNLTIADNKCKRKFIFVYQVQSDISLINFAKKLADIKEYEIIYCPFPLKKQIKCKRKPYIAPEKWLWYVENAEYVITDAFHGTVFSIIFNKLFFSQISTYGKDTGARITNILENYSLQNRLLIGDNSKYIDEKIDYSKINIQIEKERSQSINHLLNMLG